MDSKTFQRIKQIFREVVALAPEDRSGFLDSACEGDRLIRAEVDKLLEVAGEEDSFLERPAIDPRPAGSSDSDLVGTRIGRYRIERLISSGGMGTVYQAIQDHPRRAVAIKVLKDAILSQSILRRFEYEAQILARLKHPGIAQVIEAGSFARGGDSREGVGSQLPYLVMELIPEALSITDYARRKELEIGERFGLFIQACGAVHHGHQNGIIHRDLKPSNMLVDSRGQVKIIDYGVARATDSDIAVTTAHTQVGELIGTLQYMSPEQCEADPHNIDIRSDIYALGVVLYELICGELPYDVRKASLIEATRLIREEQPKKPSTVNRILRGDIETIALKALEKERSRRYQTVADFKEDIERHLAGEVILARPAGPATRIWKRARRNPVLSAALLVAVLAVLTVAVVIPWNIAATESEKSRIEKSARIAIEKERNDAVAAEKDAQKQKKHAEEQADLANERFRKIIRLSDVKRLADLEERAARLWPPYPENEDELASWIRTA